MAKFKRGDVVRLKGSAQTMVMTSVVKDDPPPVVCVCEWIRADGALEARTFGEDLLEPADDVAPDDVLAETRRRWLTGLEQSHVPLPPGLRPDTLTPDGAEAIHGWTPGRDRRHAD